TYSWRNNVEVLKDAGYLVIAVDIPPFGYSEKKVKFDYSNEAASNLVWKLLDRIDDEMGLMDMPWSLTGHSMGAGVITWMANERKQRVNGAIIVDGLLHFHISKFEQLMFNFYPVKLGLNLYTKKFLFSPRYVKKTLSSAYGRIPNEDEINHYLEPLKQKNYMEATMARFLSFKSSTTLYISDITVPVLLVWGQKDDWLSVRLAMYLQEKFPDSRLVTIEEAAHCPMETHPARFNAMLLEFLENPSSMCDIAKSDQ
ncbi:MAG: alpha/beta hydrolase, partial [Bacteroidetes bacterium]|nr:alpha/beta hydrolase [Bacteroidota bacterium]